MRDPTITNSLRHANKYPAIFAKTTKFKNSFICYGLSHYQLTGIILTFIVPLCFYVCLNVCTSLECFIMFSLYLIQLLAAIVQ